MNPILAFLVGLGVGLVAWRFLPFKGNPSFGRIILTALLPKQGLLYTLIFLSSLAMLSQNPLSLENNSLLLSGFLGFGLFVTNWLTAARVP